MMMFIYGFFACWTLFGVAIYLADKYNAITIWKETVFSVLSYGPIIWVLTIICICIGAIKALIYKMRK